MPPEPRQRVPAAAASSLARVALLLARWIERALAMEEPPLTVAQYLALRAIAEGEVVGAELARRAAVSPAAVSQLLAGLEGDGFLARRRGADDRRRQPLSLTHAGEQALRGAEAVVRAQLARLLEGVGPQETAALARALPRLEQLLSGTAPPPRRRPHPPRPRP